MPLNQFEQKRIRNIIADHLNQDDVQPGQRIMSDLGGDSLDLVEVQMAIEQELGVDLPDIPDTADPTVQDYLDLVARVRN